MARARILSSLALLMTWLALSGQAQASPYGPFNRSGDHWRVAQTRYFRFYFTDKTQRSATRLLELADATFEQLNQFYHYRPSDKIGVVVVGYTDYSNGFADYSRNHITIFSTPPDFHNRSRLPWLEGVFTHELSHILSLNTASHVWPHMPLVLGTGLVRSGTSQGLLRLPVYGLNLPHWLTEGVAQFDTYQLGRDGYDENRQAFARAAFEDELLFPLDRLAFFGGEQWYNSGFAFLLFLEHKFGPGTVHRLFQRAGEGYDLLLEQLFPRALGVSLSELEAEFRRGVGEQFRAHLALASNGAHDGSELSLPDQLAPYRKLTPSERDYLRRAYQSTPLRYLGGKLFYRAGETIFYGELSPDGRALNKPEALSAGSSLAPNDADSFLVLQPEGQSISLLPYLYQPEFESQSLSLVTRKGDTRVLMQESRLSEIDACPARAELAGVYNDGDGSLQLVLYGLDHAGSKQVSVRPGSARFPLPPQAFDEVRGPRYSPDCRRLYFSRRIGRDHDLFALDLQSGTVEAISAESAFELYPEPTADGVYYSSSRAGVMELYFRANDGSPPRRVTQAVTAHHHPVDTPRGLYFARLYGTGFHTHVIGHDQLASEPVTSIPSDKSLVRGPDAVSPSPAVLVAPSYNGFAPKHLLAPSLVPMLDLGYDPRRSYGKYLQGQVGLELYLQDELSTHALLARGFLGSNNSLVLDYSNSMLPVTLRLRGGFSASRDLYVSGRPPNRYEQVTDTRWGFLSGSAVMQLSLFHTLGLSAETTRDIGVTSGARERRFDFADPRYGRDLLGLRYEYSGIDRSQPNFRERDINKRGYRELGVGVSVAREHVDPWLTQYDASLHGGATDYLRAELDYSEYIALPSLMRGFFDHSLQIDLQLGFISHEISFLPFMGGGQLYSQSAPEYNVSVGFVGYRFYSIRGESLLNLAISYRAPIARRLGWDLGVLYLEDLYAQVFTSWGNIWGFKADGSRQIPLVDRAPNGRRLLGDVGLDLRIGNFFQEAETNVGATLRGVYRLVPFARCPDTEPTPDCLSIDGKRGFMFYAIIGGGF